MNFQSIKQLLTTTCLFLFLTVSLPIYQPVHAAESIKTCTQITGFSSNNVSSTGVDYIWGGPTLGVALNLGVWVNGSSISTGTVLGNIETIAFGLALSDGDVVTARLFFQCSDGSTGILEDKFVFRIVATSQPVLKQGECNATCDYIQFCSDDIITYGLQDFEDLNSYIFDADLFCKCMDDKPKIPLNDAIYECIEAFLDEGLEEKTDACDKQELVDCDDGSAVVNGGRMNMTLVNSITVYPNPFSDSFTLELGEEPTGEVYIQLMNVRGQLVFDQRLVEQRKVVLDASQLNPGVYWYKVYSNGMEFIDRIIKM